MVVADHDCHNGDCETAETAPVDNGSNGLVDDVSAVLVKVGLGQLAAKVAATHEAVTARGGRSGGRSRYTSNGNAGEWLFDCEVLSDFELMAMGMSRLEVRLLREHIEKLKQRSALGEGAGVTI